MEEPSRRRFLSGSLATVAGLSYGLRGGTVAGRPQTTQSPLDDGVESVFDLVPAGSAVDRGYQVVALADVSGVETTEALTYQSRQVIGSVDGLEPDAVSHVLTVRSDSSGLLGGVVGSFEGVDPGERVGTDGDWRVADTGRRAVASTDGRLAFARGERESRVEAVETAVTAARGETDTLLDTTEYATEAFERFGDKRLAFLLRDTEGSTIPLSEPVEAVAAGFTQDPNEFEGRVENEYLLFAARRLDDATAERVVRRLDPGRVVDLALSRDDGTVHAVAVSTKPPRRDREAAPDARIEATREDGSVSLVHAGDEPVSAGKLHLWVDGERPPGQPADEFDTLTEGDSITVETDTLATVTLRWLDESKNVYYDYVQRLFGGDAFETAYDVDEERLRLRYTGERPADPAKLTLRHRGGDGGRTPAGFDGDELTAGDTATVEAVAIGDRVRLSLDVPSRGIRCWSRPYRSGVR